MSSFKSPNKKLTGCVSAFIPSSWDIKSLFASQCSDFKIAKGVVVCSEAELYGDVTIGKTLYDIFFVV